jgi:hypothetical protein
VMTRSSPGDATSQSAMSKLVLLRMMTAAVSGSDQQANLHILCV